MLINLADGASESDDEDEDDDAEEEPWLAYPRLLRPAYRSIPLSACRCLAPHTWLNDDVLNVAVGLVCLVFGPDVCWVDSQLTSACRRHKSRRKARLPLAILREQPRFLVMHTERRHHYWLLELFWERREAIAYGYRPEPDERRLNHLLGTRARA